MAVCYRSSGCLQHYFESLSRLLDVQSVSKVTLCGSALGRHTRRAFIELRSVSKLTTNNLRLFRGKLSGSHETCLLGQLSFVCEVRKIISVDTDERQHM